MVSVRLNVSNRQQIKNDVMKHRFAKDVAKLRADWAAFAERIYNDVFSPATQEQMNSLPPGWLPKDDDIFVQFGTSSTRLLFNGASRQGYRSLAFNDILAVPDSVMKLFPHKMLGAVSKVYSARTSEATAYEKLVNRTEDLENLTSSSEKSLMAMLNRVTTMSALITGWPEIEAFVRPYIVNGKPTAPLPVVQVQELNDLLELPPETQEAA